jgi:signal transduction histidine kinase
VLQPDMEMLESRLQAVTDRRERIDVLNDLAWALQHSDPDRSQRLAINAGRLAASGEFEHALYEDGKGTSLLILSVLEWDRSNYSVALELAAEAEVLFERTGNLRQRAYVLNHIASIHFFLGDYSRALELGFEAIKLSEASGDRGLQASLLNDTAYINIHTGQFAEALPRLHKSLAMHREVGSRQGEAQSLDSLGKAHYLLGEYEQALAYDFEALAINRAIGYKRAETEALGNIGRIYAASGDTDKALEFFAQALAQAREREYRQFEAALLLDMGKTCLAMRRLERALDYFMQALAVAEDIESKPVIFEIHHALACVYEQVGDYVLALDHHKRFHAVKEAVFDEKTSRTIGSLHAIHETEKAKQEAEIYQLRNVALQQEIQEREKLIADLDAFARTVAHDLKSPLAVVLAYGEVAKDEMLAGRHDSALTMLDDVLRTGYKASRIVDELLLLASVRRQEVTIKSLDMGRIISQVETRLSMMFEEHEVEFITPSEWPPVLGYAPWIEEVWANYIMNAIKYGGQPPRVEVGADREDHIVRFWVRDNGDGIAPADQERLFTQFTRLDARYVEGHGLGLSIVKRIIEKLGGEVGIESSGIPGQGSVFSFTLSISS